jgi:hypothetical protein
VSERKSLAAQVIAAVPGDKTCAPAQLRLACPPRTREGLFTRYRGDISSVGRGNAVPRAGLPGPPACTGWQSERRHSVFPYLLAA